MLRHRKKNIKVDYQIKFKKGDLVRVISGKDKGKEGKIIFIDRKKGEVIVENVNMKVMHKKASGTNQGGIIKKEFGIDACKVMYLHNGVVSKIGYKFVMEEKDGKEISIKKRIARKTGEVID